MNMKMTDQLKAMLLDGRMKDIAQQKKSGTYLKYDQISVGNEGATFSYNGVPLFIMSTPPNVDLSRGDNIVITGLKGLAQFTLGD